MFTKKNFNFVNTDKPYRKKTKHWEKAFSSYLARFKKLVDYETTNEYRFCNFS